MLWGIGGALASGTLEALLYDGLKTYRATSHYSRLLGRITAAGLIAQIPAALAATVLFQLGGYALVGWLSVGCCLTAAALAWLLRDARPIDNAVGVGNLARVPVPGIGGPADEAVADDRQSMATRSMTKTLVWAISRPSGPASWRRCPPRWCGTWCSSSRRSPGWMRWRSTSPWSPWTGASHGLDPAGRAGNSAGRGRRNLVDRAPVTQQEAFLAHGFWRSPWAAARCCSRCRNGSAGRRGLAGVAVFYGLYRVVLVAVNTRLQDAITGPARATVNSVAGLLSELTAIAIYGLWALHGSVADRRADPAAGGRVAAGHAAGARTVDRPATRAARRSDTGEAMPRAAKAVAATIVR